MSIQFKLTGAIWTVCSVVLLTVYFMLQWSFDRTIKDYLDQRLIDDQGLLLQNLRTYHDSYSTFQGLEKEPWRYAAMIQASRRGQTYEEMDWAALAEQYQPRNRKGLVNHRPPPHHHRNKPEEGGRRGHPPPHLMAERDDLPVQSVPNFRESKPKSTSPQSRPPPFRMDSSQFPVLCDPSRRRVLGPHIDDGLWVSIESDQGVLLGYIVLNPMNEVLEGADKVFVERQNNTFIVILAMMFALAVLLAIPISRHFTRPIRHLDHSIGTLAAGDYRVSINENRKDELGRLSDNVRRLSQVLQQNEEMRARWIADISHELRTPLAITKGEIEAMQDGVRELNETSLASLYHEVNHLEKLVEDLHELGRADSGGIRYQFEYQAIQPLIISILEKYRSALEAKGSKLQLNLPKTMIMVELDASRFQQLLDNVLSNCLKYADDDGLLRIILTEHRGQAVLQIEDSGPGVPDKQLDKLFEYLYRVEDSRNRELGGSGLGLAICKKIVEAHAGTITAQHSDLGGLAIKICFPISKGTNS